MDYYNLGFTTGKAWRLGHMEEKYFSHVRAAEDACIELRVPNVGGDNFYRGFDAGVLAVDADAQSVHGPVNLFGEVHLEENAAQVSPPSPTSRDGLTFEERIEVLEKIAQRYHNLGNDMSFESYTTRLVLEEDVNAYFSSTPAEKQD